MARADIAPAPLGQQRLAYGTLVQQFYSTVNKSTALELSCWPTDKNHRNNNISEFQNWKTCRWFGLTREGNRGLESEVIRLNTRSRTWWSTVPGELMTSQFILFASQRHLCSSDSFFFFFFKYNFIYLFMAVLGLRFCARAFSSCGKWGPLFIAVRGPLTIAASPVAEHRLQTRRLSSCGSRA